MVSLKAKEIKPNLCVLSLVGNVGVKAAAA